jgi:hypothetical protein
MLSHGSHAPRWLSHFRIGRTQHMDVFKLAFETMIVGILSFAWLGIVIDLIFPAFFLKLVLPLWDKNQSLIGVALLSFAYCLGSAIMPISGQLVNDEHWPLPEYAIRCKVMIGENVRLDNISKETELLLYYKSTKDVQACGYSYWEIFFTEPYTGSQDLRASYDFPKTWKEFKTRKDGINNSTNHEELRTLFLLYENKVLSQGPDNNEFFRQLHERIVVLRGAVMSGTILFLLCLFRAMARLNTEKFHWQIVDRVWIKTVLGTVLALFLTWFSLHNALEDLNHPDIFDVPILEALLGLTSIFGGFWVLKGVPYRSFLNKRSVLLTAFITVFAYSGWMWSEVIYDQQIITAFAILHKGAQL